MSGHEITLQGTAHATCAECTLVHLPPGAAPVTQPWAKLCSRPEIGPCATSCRCYTSHMGAYAKCPCLRKDLQTFNILMVPPSTVCCTVLQKLGVREHPCTLRSSRLSCHLEEYPEDHRHEQTTRNYPVYALITHWQSQQRHSTASQTLSYKDHEAEGDLQEGILRQNNPHLCYHFFRGCSSITHQEKEERNSFYLALFKEGSGALIYGAGLCLTSQGGGHPVIFPRSGSRH